jgi:hypothetical protein
MAQHRVAYVMLEPPFPALASIAQYVMAGFFISYRLASTNAVMRNVHVVVH